MDYLPLVPWATVLLRGCGWEGLEPSMGPVQALLECRLRCLLLGPWTGRCAGALWLRQGWSPVTWSFQNLQSDRTGRFTSRGSWTVAKRGWGSSQATSGSIARIKVCMPIIWYMNGHDLYWVPWCMVLETRPKPNRVVAESSGVWSSFHVCIWDHGQRVSFLGASQLSQNGSPWSWTALRFHNLLLESQSSHKCTSICW